jgi:hypothetical protein
VLAQYVDVTNEHAPEGSQFLEGRWYAPKWGVDTLQHVLEALSAAPQGESATKPVGWVWWSFPGKPYRSVHFMNGNPADGDSWEKAIAEGSITRPLPVYAATTTPAQKPDNGDRMLHPCPLCGRDHILEDPCPKIEESRADAFADDEPETTA